jgi:hypothetical protein
MVDIGKLFCWLGWHDYLAVESVEGLYGDCVELECRRPGCHAMRFELDVSSASMPPCTPARQAFLQRGYEYFGLVSTLVDTEDVLFGLTTGITTEEFYRLVGATPVEDDSVFAKAKELCDV